MRTGTFLILDGNWSGGPASFNVVGAVSLTSDVGSTITDGDLIDGSAITDFWAFSGGWEYTMNDGTVFNSANAPGSSMIIQLADGRTLLSLGNSLFQSPSDEIAANGSGVATVNIPAGDSDTNTAPAYYLGGDSIPQPSSSEYTIGLYPLEQIPGVPEGSVETGEAYNTGGTITFSNVGTSVTITDDDAFAEDITNVGQNKPETGDNAVLTLSLIHISEPTRRS